MRADQAIWTEKYRPTTLDEVVGHETAVDRFKKFLDPEAGGGLPNCLLYGPPGVGKTAVAAAWAEEFYGDEMEANFREFNASDDRGIDVVREQIKSWCRATPTEGFPFKVILLDEADQLTKEAQSALRRMMEQYSDTTRFILTGNYVSRIIEPLQSRCAAFHFGEVSDEAVFEAIERIVAGEELTAEGSVVDQIVQSASGRPRDAIVTLSLSVDEGRIREDWVDLHAGVADRDLVETAVLEALAGEFDAAMQATDDLLKDGVNPHRLLDAFHSVIHEADEMPEDWRVRSYDLLGTMEERLYMGVNPHVQFHALLGHLYMAQAGSAYRQQGGDA